MDAMENRNVLNDEELEKVCGGVLSNCPGSDTLNKMGLGEYVRNPEAGIFDIFYDTNRGNGEWKHVGSEDMLKYVERTLGADDPRYQALEAYTMKDTSSGGWVIDF